MDRLTIACVQQRMRLPRTVEDYRDDLRRFMRVAEAKHARLVVFPELAGLMLTPPMLGDFRSSMLKRADLGRRRNASLWQRIVSAVANTTASWFKADFRTGIAALLEVAPNDVWQRYVDLFGGLAREYGMTLVAPSAYLPDPVDGVIRNITGVFGANGDLLGLQSKVMLHPEDTDIAQAGSTWDVIQTEVGRLGIMIGSDVLYPEVGRLLAYQGAEVLITQGACPNPVLYNKMRAGALARMQDNQLFGVAAFLVGHNELSRIQREPFVGRSAIFAPQELTPRFNGVLVEMGNTRSEGVLAAEWDFVALKRLWETSDTPVRQQMPLAQAGQTLAKLYARLQSLPRVSEHADNLLEEMDGENGQLLLEDDDRFTLDDLPVLSTITARWPMPPASPAPGNEADTDEASMDATEASPTGNPEAQDADGPDIKRSAASATDQPAEDETDEMDALPGPTKVQDLPSATGDEIDPKETAASS